MTKKATNVAKEATKEAGKSWTQWLLLASLGIDQLVINFKNFVPLLGNSAPYILGVLWFARIGFIVWKASKNVKPA